MAQGEKSKLTKVTEGVLGRLRNIDDHYKEKPATPYLMEKVGKPDARARFQAMTPEQRAEVVNQVGIDAVMELMRKRGSQ